MAPPSGPPSPPYAVDAAVASAWSGQDAQEIAKSWSTGSGGDEYDRRRSPPEGGAKARPDLVKRATSNQNETVETRPSLQGPSVKRAALNRDNSLASNLLKEQYVPGYRKSGTFNPEHAMSQLTENMEQSTLETGQESPLLQPPLGGDGDDDGTDPTADATATQVHPKPLTRNERMTTFDHIAMDLMVKPVLLTSSARSPTIEALALDLDDDPCIRPEPLQRGRTMEEVFHELRDGVPKPASLSKTDRLTTNDLLDIVNEPLVDDDVDDDAEVFSNVG